MFLQVGCASDLHPVFQRVLENGIEPVLEPVQHFGMDGAQDAFIARLVQAAPDLIGQAGLAYSVSDRGRGGVTYGREEASDAQNHRVASRSCPAAASTAPSVRSVAT